MKTLSIVVPCRDEEDNLSPLLARLAAAPLAPGWERRVVLVDDGSRDATWARMKALAETGAAAAARLDGNHGVQKAILAGLSLARGDAAAVMDADLQDPPELLGALLRALEESGAGAAVALKTRRRDSSRALAAAKWAAGRLLPFAPGEGDFCVMSGPCVRRLVELGRDATPFRVRRLWALGGRPPAYVPYERDARESGRSKFGGAALARLFWVMVRELARGPGSSPPALPGVAETAGDFR